MVGIGERITFLEVTKKPIICKFLTTEENLNGGSFSHRSLSDYLNTGTKKESFQWSVKQDSCNLMQFEKISLYVSKFRLTNKIQSGPHASEQSRSVITFLRILGFTVMTCV